jgi:hypothetical protein
MTTSAAKPPATVTALLDALEKLLRAELENHQQLLACLERKQQAIRTADIAAVTKLCADEQTIVRRLGEVERHRSETCRRIASTARPAAPGPMAISELAQIAEEAQQTRLIALAAQLREVVTRIKRQSSIVRAAAEALSRHMSGIVQTVHSALSRARIYGQRGAITLGAQVHSSLDLKS